MNLRTIFTVLAFSLLSVSAFAQDRQGRRERMNTTEVYTRQAERLVKAMKLDDEKKDLFTVLYLDYQAARHNAANPKGESAQDERIDMKKITDEQATALIQKRFAQTEAQLAVDKEYYPKFLEILTPTQVAQVYLPQRVARDGQQGGQRPGGFGGRGGFGGQGGFGGPGGFGGQGDNF